MTLAKFFEKFKSKFLWGNLLGMFVVIILFVIILLIGMNLYTRHGESIEVPKLRGMLYSDVDILLREANLTPVIIDTDYVASMPDGSVLEQMPSAGATVKAGRQIFITVNSTKSPLLTLPDIIDNTSLRQAMAKLKAMGFRLGTPQPVSGDADWVYGVLADGHRVYNGERIAADKRVVIQYGNGDTEFEEDYSDLDELLEDDFFGEDGDITLEEFDEI